MLEKYERHEKFGETVLRLIGRASVIVICAFNLEIIQYENDCEMN
jgi:hypothetical protein